MNNLRAAAEQALEALEWRWISPAKAIDVAKETLRQALAHGEQSNSIWVLTREINAYEQDGEYFVDAWNTKPTHQMLSALRVSQNGLRHILNGGGRVGYENEWFYLKEIKHD